MVEGRHKEVVFSKGDDAAAACISLSKKLNLNCESKSVQIKGCLLFMYVQVWINPTLAFIGWWRPDSL
jgi:hypothetical protein